jgi:hypothetical protein
MRRTIIAVAAVMLAAGALAGCREEEQGRALILDKGTYAGPKDATLSKTQLDELKDRALQQGPTGTSTSAAEPLALEAGPREVKDNASAKAQDSSPPLPEATLNDRLKMQSGR